jgi:hypothetical protein
MSGIMPADSAELTAMHFALTCGHIRPGLDTLIYVHGGGHVARVARTRLRARGALGRFPVQLAAALLAPYLASVSFATVLNCSVWQRYLPLL